MRSTYRLLIGAAAAMFVSGCALQDSRYDNSRLAAGLGDYDESIIDWNFPTSTNQGPLLPPERFRPWPAAIGVPWATNGDAPSPRSDLTPLSDAGPPAQAAGHDTPRACASECDAASAKVDADLRVDARVREPLQHR
jgi:hypothetical protein